MQGIRYSSTRFVTWSACPVTHQRRRGAMRGREEDPDPSAGPLRARAADACGCARTTGPRRHPARHHQPVRHPWNRHRPGHQRDATAPPAAASSWPSCAPSTRACPPDWTCTSCSMTPARTRPRPCKPGCSNTPVPPAPHPDRIILAQPGQAVLRPDHRQTAATRRPPLDHRTGQRHPRWDRTMEHPPQAQHPDPHRKPDLESLTAYRSRTNDSGH